MHNNFYRQMVFTQKVLRTEVLRAENFTHNIFYIQTFLDTDAFTQKTDCTRHAFTRKQFLHIEVLFPLLHHLPFVFPLSIFFGNTVLDDPAATLSAYNLETGCSLTMVVENPGPNILHATINDRHDSTDSCYTWAMRPGPRSLCIPCLASKFPPVPSLTRTIDMHRIA